MKKDFAQQHLTVELPVTYQDIYDALAEVGMPTTVANVKMLANYVRQFSRDVAASTLWDWVLQQKGINVS